MIRRLLIDTHIALWLDSGDDHLKRPTRELIDGCWAAGGVIYLSAVSAWEIALLADTGRIGLDLTARGWIERFLDRPGIAAAPLDLRCAAGAYDFSGLEHRDPADRLLVATAIALEAPLVTYDARILGYARSHGLQHGFEAIGAAA